MHALTLEFTYRSTVPPLLIHAWFIYVYLLNKWFLISDFCQFMAIFLLEPRPPYGHGNLSVSKIPVPGEFPSQRPVTRSFDVFFHLRLNKRLSKQSWGWWFETPSRSLWRHCNDIIYEQVSKAKPRLRITFYRFRKSLNYVIADKMK